LKKGIGKVHLFKSYSERSVLRSQHQTKMWALTMEWSWSSEKPSNNFDYDFALRLHFWILVSEYIFSKTLKGKAW